MKNPLSSDTSSSTGLLLGRVMVGIVLALAGTMKLRAAGGVNAFVSDHISQVPGYMPNGFGNLYLHSVPYAELGLGLLLIAGLLTRVSGLLASLMLISFGMIQAGTSGFVNTHPDNAAHLFQSPAIFGGLALIAFLAGPGRFSIDGFMWGARKR